MSPTQNALTLALACAFGCAPHRASDVAEAAPPRRAVPPPASDDDLPITARDAPAMTPEGCAPVSNFSRRRPRVVVDPRDEATAIFAAAARSEPGIARPAGRIFWDHRRFTNAQRLVARRGLAKLGCVAAVAQSRASSSRMLRWDAHAGRAHPTSPQQWWTPPLFSDDGHLAVVVREDRGGTSCDVLAFERMHDAEPGLGSIWRRTTQTPCDSAR